MCDKQTNATLHIRLGSFTIANYDNYEYNLQLEFVRYRKS